MPLIPDIVIESFPRLLSGTWVTIQITALSVSIGLCLAVPVALMRVAKNRLISTPSYVFCFYFRGTPLLVQIFLIYYGSGQFVDFLETVGLWQFLKPAFSGIMCLSLYATLAIFQTGLFLRHSHLDPQHCSVHGRNPAGGHRGRSLGRNRSLPRLRHEYAAYVPADHPAQSLSPGLAGLHQRGCFPPTGHILGVDHHRHGSDRRYAGHFRPKLRFL